MRVLVVERPSGGMVHAALFVRGGRGDTGGLPPSSVEVVAQSLFGRYTSADLTTATDIAVQEEEALYESMRREMIQRLRSEPGAAPPEVAALHAKAMARLIAGFGGSDSLDLMEQLGVTARLTRTNADFLFTSVDLPAAQMGPWARLEAQRLSQLHLYRFPLERERWLQALHRSDLADPGLSPLLGSAFVGQSYASTMDENPGAIAGLTRTDARALALRLFAPERMLLVLVGDVSAESAAPMLETNFGRLGSSTEGQSFPFNSIPSMGALRLAVISSTAPRLYMGWRIPPASDPDTLAITLAMKVLGQGSSSRLHGLLDHGMAQSVKAEVGVPGSRALNLLLITAKPGEGRGLPELEMAIRGEVLRLQEELVPGDEFQKALGQLQLQYLTAEEDPASFASALGSSWAVLGDWRQAFVPIKRRREVRPEEIQRVARLHLATDRAIVGIVEPDRTLTEDPLDRKLAQALRALAKQKGVEPAKAETLVQEGLRQLQMLPRDQRAATLKLLESSSGGPRSKEGP